MSHATPQNAPDASAPNDDAAPADTPPVTEANTRPREYGGPKGLEPTRYGDWERKGRCVDF